MSITQLDRYRGALLGLAAGDAVGTTLEFRPPGTFQPISDMVGGGPFNLKPGQWTDDTSMALCLAESLVERQGFDLSDQLKRYVRWYRSGYLSSTGHCFDIGNTIRQALHQFEQTGDPHCGQTHPHSAGNGSIMRLAPVPLAYAWQPAMAIEKSAESSRTTHASQVAVDACRYFGALLVGAANGETKEALLSSRYCPIPSYWQSNPLTRKIDKIATGSFKTLSTPAVKGSGYVVDSLEAALWAFYRSSTFREGCLMAVNLGDDADTTGAVYGQLAGAYYGASSIPETWRSRLAMDTMIEELALKLFELRQREPA